jgi:protein-S-isoprenylcysteine O-methyltransferase Ste14
LARQNDFIIDEVSMNSKVISILGFLLAVVGLGALILKDRLFTSHPISIAVQVASFGLMIWARMTLGRRSFHAAADPTAGNLITTGPYRYWRHPIYAAVIYFAWAGVLPQLSPEAFVWSCLVTAGLVVRMMMEERLLRGKYPEYATYAGRTKRFVPFIL